MEAVTCRLLPYAVAAGPRNMAADEALLESALAGAASLRFYGWSEPTVSLGYFQPQRVRREDPRLTALPFVRRPSGGMTLVHHHEVTYALALPAGPPWQTGEPWLTRMHWILATALETLGVRTRLQTAAEEQHFEGSLCFRHFTAGDLLLGDAKVVGSAQRRRRGALLQHGAILLATSPHTPVLPGIAELSGRGLSVAEVCGAVVNTFGRETGWELNAADWTVSERTAIEELTRNKYEEGGWNWKR